MAEARTASRRIAATSRGGAATSRRRATATEAPPKDREREQASGDKASAQVCPVPFCPVGLALSVMRNARPDVIDHLQAAAREFLLAAKAVVDTRAGDVEEAAGSAELERIEIE
jgi:hypothetical protein